MSVESALESGNRHRLLFCTITNYRYDLVLRWFGNYENFVIFWAQIDWPEHLIQDTIALRNEHR